MPVDWETAEEKGASKIVDQLLRQVEDIRDTLTTMDRQIRAPKITAKLGEIGQNILETNMFPQRDKLSSLPAELQHMMWSYLTFPADRIAFALTCKMHASVFEELKSGSKTSKSTKKSAKDGAKPGVTKKTTASRTVVTKLDRIHVLHRLRDWMPKQYKLCYNCARYLSKTSKSKGSPAVVDKGSWSGRWIDPIEHSDEKTIKDLLKKAIAEGYRCPDCCVRNRLACVATKANFKQLKKNIGSLV